MKSVTVEFRTSSHGSVVVTYTTTNTSQTEVIQTGLQCATLYYMYTTVVSGETRDGEILTHTEEQASVSFCWKYVCMDFTHGGLLPLHRYIYS